MFAIFYYFGRLIEFRRSYQAKIYPQKAKIKKHLKNNQKTKKDPKSIRHLTEIDGSKNYYKAKKISYRESEEEEELKPNHRNRKNNAIIFV